ncbi:MAG: exodeoxyribonuclease III [Anaerovoracaceae bacterium]
MKLITWNVNGLRACIKKGFFEYVDESKADFICLQETKMEEGQVEVPLEGYFQFWNSAKKKGYSGTAIFTTREPLRVYYDIGIDRHSCEGRAITLEYDNFYLVNEYAPNSREGLTRILYRMDWEDSFRDYVKGLDEKKPVIICGDLNVAHKEIDLKNPSTNRGRAGFSDEERGKFQELLDVGFTDAFRLLYPDKTGAYTWWSYRFNARANNAGWRIDYFLVSDRITDAIQGVSIHSHVLGSDHCPVEVMLYL